MTESSVTIRSNTPVSIYTCASNHATARITTSMWFHDKITRSCDQKVAETNAIIGIFRIYGGFCNYLHIGNSEGKD